MCVYSSVHPHNVMKRGSMTVLGNTIQKRLTGTAFRSYNLLKQEREIQVHKTELLTMEFRHLHLTFCKIEFILTTEGQISQCLETLIISVETFQFCIFDSLLKNCQRCNCTSNLANLRLPNRGEAALPFYPTSISACSSAVPAPVWPRRSTCWSGCK